MAVTTCGDLSLEPLAEAHREPLRAACACDPAIWEIYFTSFLDPHFDQSFDAAKDREDRCVFAIHQAGALVGMSGFLDIQPEHRALEIGMTYLVPAVRGTGLNRRVKALLLARAFACGFGRVQFKVDLRNQRSQAAMAKLGAVREGVLRDHLITWNGHVRSSAIFSILAHEWPRG